MNGIRLQQGAMLDLLGRHRVPLGTLEASCCNDWGLCSIEVGCSAAWVQVQIR